MFDSGNFVPADGVLIVSDPTNTKLRMPPFHSLLRATWGLKIIAVVATRSVVQTANFLKRV
jgi:hypothetical protein